MMKIMEGRDFYEAINNFLIYIAVLCRNLFHKQNIENKLANVA